MGGEALGLAKILCPTIGEWQGQEAGVGGLGLSLDGLSFSLCKTTNQGVHMEGPKAPAAYIAEDGLVGHQ